MSRFTSATKNIDFDLKFFQVQFFFGCLPLRLGVIALSLIQMVGSSIVTVTAWSQIMQLSAHPIPLSNEVALFFHSITFTVLAALGLVGLVSGSLNPPSSPSRKSLLLNFLLTTTILLFLSLLLSFSSGAFVLYTIFHRKSPEDVVRCLNGVQNDDLTKQVCENGIAVIRGVAVGIYLIGWMIVGYTTLIVHSYYSFLKSDQASLKFTMDSNPDFSLPADTDTESQMDFRDPSSRTLTPSPTFGSKPWQGHHKFPSVTGPIRREDISGPKPLTMFNSMGAPGVNTGYAFSTVDNSFGGLGEGGVEGNGRRVI